MSVFMISPVSRRERGRFSDTRLASPRWQFLSPFPSSFTAEKKTTWYQIACNVPSWTLASRCVVYPPAHVPERLWQTSGQRRSGSPAAATLKRNLVPLSSSSLVHLVLPAALQQKRLAFQYVYPESVSAAARCCPGLCTNTDSLSLQCWCESQYA